MAGIYKVWARCCVRPKGKRIERVWDDDLKDAIFKVMDVAVEEGTIDYFTEEGEMDDEKYSSYFEKAEQYFAETGCIGVGDYEIVRAYDAAEIQIPNVCSYDTFIFK